MATMPFPRAALGWAVLNFFVQFLLSFTSPHSANHAVIYDIVIVCLMCGCLVVVCVILAMVIKLAACW